MDKYIVEDIIARVSEIVYYTDLQTRIYANLQMYNETMHTLYLAKCYNSFDRQEHPNLWNLAETYLRRIEELNDLMGDDEGWKNQ